LSDKTNLTATAWQTIGPFFHFALTDPCSVASIGGEADGERIRLVCGVRDGDDAPVTDAMIELWQADGEGRYNHGTFRGFARLSTDARGSCIFETIVPGRVPGRQGKLQAPHIEVSLFARGLLNRLVTRIYFAGNAANEDDEVLALIPHDRRGSLMAYPGPSDTGTWNFDIRMCSDCETVFFDV
jgi:protocatechuate 3,4-dioxygenase alpha subunit